MAKYVNLDKLLEDIEHNVVFTLRPDKPSSINTELRGARKIIDRIQCAPAADVVEVRHGRWVWKRRHHGGFRKYMGVDEFGETHTITVDERSECDEPYCPYCGKWNESVFRNYCPYCGAKMDGGVNDAAD